MKEAGRKISAEHTDLDQKTRDIADKLGVPLPASPNAQQLGWMKEIASKTGSDYDRTAVQRLREAHGIVLPILAQVRISTRNDLVREFAADGTLYVTRHIGYLESTGLVDYSALPEPPSPGLLSGSANWTDLLVPGLVLIACLLAATLIGASLRGRGKANKAAQLPPMVTTSAPRVATAAALIALPEAASTARSASVHPDRLATGDVAGDAAGRDSRRPDPGRRNPEIPDHRQRTPRRPSLAATDDVTRPASARIPAPPRGTPSHRAPRSPAPNVARHAVRTPALRSPATAPRPAPSGDGPNPDRGTDAAPPHVPPPARPPPPRRLGGRGRRHDRADRVRLRRCRPDGHAHSLGAHGRHEHGRPGPQGAPEEHQVVPVANQVPATADPGGRRPPRPRLTRHGRATTGAAATTTGAAAATATTSATTPVRPAGRDRRPATDDRDAPNRRRRSRPRSGRSATGGADGDNNGLESSAADCPRRAGSRPTHGFQSGDAQCVSTRDGRGRRRGQPARRC